MAHRKKYPRHCCKKCHIMHRTYHGAMAHKKELMGHSAPRHHKRRHRSHHTGFAAMPAKKRRAAARKGGIASARARGYR